MTEAAPAHPSSPAAQPPRGHRALHDELHARPPLQVDAACVVSYWAQQGLPAEAAETALRLACASAGQAAPAADAQHFLLDADHWALKYERHGEFASWQVRQTLDASQPLAQQLAHADARRALPEGFLACIRHTPMLAATHVLVWPADDDMALPQARRLLAQAAAADDSHAAPNLLGAWIADRRAALLTHLTLDASGFTRFLLLDVQLSPQQRGREVQRVVEIEGYRSLAMLGFPLAQQESHSLTGLERRLLQAVDHMAAPESANPTPRESDQHIFAQLVALAAEVEHAAARSRYRFSATRAYHRIVQRRLADLREDRIEGVQTLGGFLARRFTPAMEFCDSTDSRLSDVAARVQRAVDVVQIRTEAQREADNQQLLQALAHRQQVQLRLQQTVEGLSVVAISYYAVSLLAYVFKMLKSIPAIEALHIPLEAAVGASVLPVLLLVAWSVRRIRLHHAAD